MKITDEQIAAGKAEFVRQAQAETGSMTQSPTRTFPMVDEARERMLSLAERCERHAILLTENAFNGWDNMRHGKEDVRGNFQEAANAFAIAAALRASARNQQEG